MESSRTQIIWKWTRRILPVALGALGGYLYYHFIGCDRGCAITGNPWSSTMYGAVIGLILTNWKTKAKLLQPKENEQ
ncbi:MAG: hypothetical protein KGZ85_00770 [Ignavibacterium sp.]|nr:hypothetical protein [Ignavibacterium sp.]